MIETQTIDDRKVFFADVGDMPPEQALQYLKEIKEKFGKTTLDCPEIKK